MIKVVHATAAKGVPVSVAPGAVRAVLRSNGTVLAATPQMLQSLGRSVARTPGPQRALTAFRHVLPHAFSRVCCMIVDKSR